MTDEGPVRLHRFARLAPNLRMLTGSIKGQIFIVFAVTFMSVFILLLLDLWSLYTVKARLLLGERYYELLNDILEVRRFEKNYLFYNDNESLEEGTAYLQRIDALASELSEDIADVAGQKTFDSFLVALRTYEQTLAGYPGRDRTGASREEIRQQGKNLVDFAENLLSAKKQRIHKALLQTSVVPFAFLAIFLVLVFLVIKLVSQGLLRPLKVLQATTRRVAKGDYAPTVYEGFHTDEMSGLIEAFNHMARELEANQEHLLQARKIAALGTFTAGIAHELNNPINNIQLTAETFFEEYMDRMDADARELIRDILMQAERAGDIVRNLLDFSRTERQTFSSLHPMDVVRSTVALVKNQIMLAGIKLVLDVPEGPPLVHGSLRKLQQVFMNLLLNAIQAMPNGGIITIAVEPAETGDFMRFDVQDTGVGIDALALQHIFEPFFTTKSVGRGTGLGLAASYSIVKRHGGRIEVRSEAGKGSVFSVYLPVARDGEAENAGEEKSRHAGANSHS
jgi:two-component system, NtrC family, sensor kinase